MHGQLRRGGVRNDGQHPPVDGRTGEGQSGAASRVHLHRTVGVAGNGHLAVPLVKREHEVPEQFPADRGKLVGQVDDGLGDRVAADEEVLVEPAGELAAVALQRGDEGADARAVGEARMQAGGIEAEAAVAAGIDEHDERFTAHLDRDERRALLVVERDGGDGGRWRQDRGGPGGLGDEDQPLTGVIERQQRVAEDGEADDAVDAQAEVAGEVGEIKHQRLHPVEGGVPQRQSAKCDRLEVDLAPVGRADVHGLLRLALPLLQRETLGEVGRHVRHGRTGVDEEAIGVAVLPPAFDDKEIGNDAGRQLRGPDRGAEGRGGAAGNQQAEHRGQQGERGNKARPRPAGPGGWRDGGVQLRPGRWHGNHLAGGDSRELRPRAPSDRTALTMKTDRPPKRKKAAPARTGVTARESEPRERKIPSTRPCSSGPA